MDSERSLSVIQAPWTSSNLKTNIESKARIYVRPIQFDISAPAIAPECETSRLKKGNPSYRALDKIVVGKRVVNKLLIILFKQSIWLGVIHHATNEHQRILSYGAGQRACSHEPVGGGGGAG